MVFDTFYYYIIDSLFFNYKPCKNWLDLLFHCSEREKVKSFREKISTWQGQVNERLQILSRKTGLQLLLIWLNWALFYDLLWKLGNYLNFSLFASFAHPHFRWYVRRQGIVCSSWNEYVVSNFVFTVVCLVWIYIIFQMKHHHVLSSAQCCYLLCERHLTCTYYCVKRTEF